ncbi:MAG: hypothetical protein WBC08_07135 [Rhodoferax sp.]
MSTIDIGITAKPEFNRIPSAPIAARPIVVAPARVADDGFYVGSVKIEPVAPSRVLTPA